MKEVNNGEDIRFFETKKDIHKSSTKICIAIIAIMILFFWHLIDLINNEDTAKYDVGLFLTLSLFMYIPLLTFCIIALSHNKRLIESIEIPICIIKEGKIFYRDEDYTGKYIFKEFKLPQNLKFYEYTKVYKIGDRGIDIVNTIRYFSRIGISYPDLGEFDIIYIPFDKEVFFRCLSILEIRRIRRNFFHPEWRLDEKQTRCNY